MIPGAVIIPILIGDASLIPVDAILTEDDLPVMDELDIPLQTE